MIPGSNLLNMALGVIGSQVVKYYRDIGREKLDNGIWVTQFAPVEVIRTGSAQAIQRSKEDQNGLWVSRTFLEWIVPRKVLGVERDASGDEIEWGGKRWVIGSTEDWQEQDGWCVALCEEKIQRRPTPQGG